MKRWTRVSKRSRCPVCDRPDWCIIAPDGTAAICMRITSDRSKILKDGATGYIHQLGDNPAPLPREYFHETAAEVNLDVDAILRRWSMDTTQHLLAELASSLNVSAISLQRLGATWSKRYQAWGFPMVNGAGVKVGIRLRNMAGDKWAVRGSHSGLFLPDLTGAGPIIIAEGPTDTAALLDLGFDAIGRAACAAGEKELRKLLTGIRTEIVICADTDVPGQRGAAKLALALGNCKIITPLEGKDARQWLKMGATRDVVISIINNTRPADPRHLRQLIQRLAKHQTVKRIEEPSLVDGSSSSLQNQSKGL